ncbi:MAG: pyridoxamine 5'-phosphate oxidase family protein [Terrisporobacter sp.]|uniref:pyridoxamine 5'-phosphate oxidase family protein n=1 Tax=Terrisporobacter sp. TaxID=1965305 RepID=UPI002FC80AF6
MRIENMDVTDVNVLRDIISQCQVVRVGMCTKNKPYIVPLNYGYEISNEQLILYCYCTSEGKKLDILRENPNVFIEIDRENNLIQKDASYKSEYFSILSSGKAEFVDLIYDKIHGLNKIIEHQASHNNSKIKHESINNINLIKIKCNNLTAKNCFI